MIIFTGTCDNDFLLIPTISVRRDENDFICIGVVWMNWIVGFGFGGSDGVY